MNKKQYKKFKEYNLKEFSILEEDILIKKGIIKGDDLNAKTKI